MTPQWKDEPDAPGLWLRVIDGQSSVSGHHVQDHECNADCWAAGSRFFGPIPPDPEFTGGES